MVNFKGRAERGQKPKRKGKKPQNLVLVAPNFSTLYPHSCLVCPRTLTRCAFPRGSSSGPFLERYPITLAPGFRTQRVRDPLREELTQAGRKARFRGIPRNSVTPRAGARLPQPVGARKSPQHFAAPGLALPFRRSGSGPGETGELPRAQIPWPQAPRCKTMTGGWCSLSERRLAARSWHRLA